MGGRKAGWMYGWLDGRSGGRMSKRSDVRMGECVDGRMYRRMEGEGSQQIYFFTICLTSLLSGSCIRII